MDAVFVIRIEAVMVQVHHDDVRQRQFLDVRLRVARPMEDKGNQRQRFSEAQRRPRLHQLPFVLLRPF